MKDILEKLLNGEIGIEDAEQLLKAQTILEYSDTAKFDIHRKKRTGFPEAVFSPSKNYDDLIGIIKSFIESSDENLIV